MIGAEALLNVLNLDFYFTVPGRFTIPLNVSLKKLNAKRIMIPDERCAGHAADGYARVSGKPAGLVVSAGPGALNAVLPVATAYRDYVPMTIIAGDVPTYSRSSLAVEEIDLKSVFKPICKDIICIDDNRDLLSVKRLIENSVKPPRRPVFIDFPLDQQEAEMDSLKNQIKEVTEEEKTESLTDKAREAAKLLESSKKPLILIGNGCIEVHDVIARFAEQYHIPIAYTLMSWCRIESKPRISVGFCGIRGFKMANQALIECDFLLALGARLAETTIAYGLSEDSSIVQVLVEDHFHSRASLRVRSTCEDFIKVFIEQYHGDKKSFWVKHVDEPGYKSKTFNSIKRLLDATRSSTLSLDIGDSSMWALEAIKHGWQGLILYPGGLATMGFSISAALGAQLARPDKRIVAITGDGGALMSLPALHAISKLKLPIMMVVFNNEVYGMVRGKQLRDYGLTSDIELGFNSFENLAEAAGIKYLEIKDESEINHLAYKCLEEPILVEIKVEADDRPPTPKKLFPKS
ncbi:MAG: thiamine pyrophosphate-binding protein [Candidatus Nezhaarchaeales archaeon]